MDFESGNAKVRKARFDDIKEISKNMRQSDIDEVWASNHLTPIEALERSYKESVICLTIVLYGKPIGMFGVCPFTLIGKGGRVWLLGTTDLCLVSKKLLRYSKKFIDIMLSYYPYLTNYVSVKNKLSIRWLKFCGARFSDPAPYGVEKELFCKFELGEMYANN